MVAIVAPSVAEMMPRRPIPPLFRFHGRNFGGLRLYLVDSLTSLEGIRLMPSTEELVDATRAGDSSAFAQLVRRYERAAVITACAVLGDFHAAQDATQEAFVVAYGNLNQLRSAATFGPWLLKIVKRQALRLRESSRPEQINVEVMDAPSGEANAWVTRYREVIEELERLPEHERTVVVLRYVEGNSVQQIADLVGKPVGTVTKQLSRAVRRLREWFARATT